MIRDELTQAVEMGVISFDMSTRVGMEIDHLRRELSNANGDVEQLKAIAVELSLQLIQARKWSSAWKEWSKWAFHYWRHTSACASFAEEQAA